MYHINPFMLIYSKTLLEYLVFEIILEELQWSNVNKNENQYVVKS